MALRTRVKVGNITNLSDARYCAGMGVDMIGFVVDDNGEHFVSASKATEIANWLAGVQVLIETESHDLEEILDKIKTYQPDVVQISHASLLIDLSKQTAKPIILRIEADQDADNIYHLLENNAPYVDFFLIESSSASGFSGDWPLFMAPLVAQYPIFLGFGLQADSIVALLDNIAFEGIALRGSDEIRPGFKNFGDLMDILEVLEED